MSWTGMWHVVLIIKCGRMNWTGMWHVVLMIKCRRMIWTGMWHVWERKINVSGVLVGKPEGNLHWRIKLDGYKNDVG